jgi:hypothetical protein
VQDDSNFGALRTTVIRSLHELRVGVEEEAASEKTPEAIDLDHGVAKVDADEAAILGVSCVHKGRDLVAFQSVADEERRRDRRPEGVPYGSKNLAVGGYVLRQGKRIEHLDGRELARRRRMTGRNWLAVAGPIQNVVLVP